MVSMFTAVRAAITPMVSRGYVVMSAWSGLAGAAVTKVLFPLLSTVVPDCLQEADPQASVGWLGLGEVGPSWLAMVTWFSDHHLAEGMAGVARCRSTTTPRLKRYHCAHH